ncbi:hypothetical protein GCM10010404_31880 [Nonomuraea africana]
MRVVERCEGTRVAGKESFDQDAVIHVTEGNGLVTSSSTDSFLLAEKRAAPHANNDRFIVLSEHERAADVGLSPGDGGPKLLRSQDPGMRPESPDISLINVG